ncbi:zinc finger BED domain-containing protein RICESLEEPER 2 [Tanacetum coccineum]
MKSKTIGYGFRHLIENGIIAMEVDEESDETPIKSLTNKELCDKLVKRVEKDMRVLFAYKFGNKFSGGEDELTKYLKELHLELENDEDFDILNSWKLNNILSIQVSTVVFESAFSSNCRILDPYRNSLAPTIVEALVCKQDWIRTSSRNITMDTLEDLMKDDELAKEIQEGLDQQKGEQTHGKGENVAT